jgi:hypothetical protein
LWTTKKEYGDYYRRYKLLDPASQSYRVKEFWMDGTLKCRFSANGNALFAMIGEYKAYNRKGYLIYETSYDKKPDYYGHATEQGPRNYYYDNGKKMAVEIKGEKDWNITSYWDSSGIQKVINGKGYMAKPFQLNDSCPNIQYFGKVENFKLDSIWTGLYPDGKVYCRDEYVKGEFKKGVSYDPSGKEYKYNVLIESNIYSTIENKLVNTIIDKLPFKANDNGMSREDSEVPVFLKTGGQICHVEVAINEEGDIRDVKVLKGINDKADASVIETIRSISKIKPSAYRGQHNWDYHVVSIALPE